MKRIQFEYPARAGLTLALAGVLAACGGSGGGGGGGGAPGGGGDGGGGEPQALSQVPPATFDSEETVALLAPGSTYGDTVGLTASGLAFFGSVGDVEDSRVTETRDCDDGGRVAFLYRENQAVDSPYNGGVFDVVATDDQNCQDGDLNAPSSFAETRTDGERHIGYPVSGTGSGDPASAQVFIGYERSGTGLDDPFSVVLRTDGGGGLRWSRYWDGHIRMERGSAQGSRLGDGGGATELYQVSRLRSGGRDGIGYDLQTGTGTGDRFQMSFQAINQRPASKYRSEAYQGVYGRRFLDPDGRPIGGDCPAGRFQVETRSDLTVDVPDNDQSELLLFGDTRSIVSGGLAMEDNDGNTAQVVYDGSAGTVQVTLNNGTARTFTYQALSDALRARCFTAP